MPVEATLFCGVFKFDGESLELGMVVFLMRVCGLWDGDRWPGWARSLYVLNTAWALLWIAWLGLTQGAAALLLSGDLVTVATNTCLFIEVVSGMFKYGETGPGQRRSWKCAAQAPAFLQRRARLRRMLARLNTLAAGSLPVRGGRAARAALAGAGRTSLAVTVSFMLVGFTSVVTWFLHPLFNGTGLRCWAERAAAAARANATEPEPLCTEPLFPTEALYPFDVRSNPGYAYGYVSQLFGIYYIYMCTCTIDLLYVSVMMYFTALLHILTEDLAALQPGTDPQADARLLECVKFYNEIASCARELQSAISLPVMVQLSASGLVICMSLYAVSISSSDDIAATAKLIFYLMDMYFEIFIYCWFGDQVIQKSEEVAEAAYASAWYKGGTGFRRGTLLTMGRAQRRIAFQGGVFYELSRATFLSLTQASYSFFNLLRSVE